MERTHLRLELALPIRACNAGLFISRGQGRHPDRVIDSYELIFVRSGILSIQEEDRPFAVGPDQFLLLWPYRRRGTAPFPPDLSFYWLHFYLRENRDDQTQDSPAILTIPRYGTVSRPESLTELFRRFLDNQEAGRNHPPIGDLLVALMLCEVAGENRVNSNVDKAAVLANRAEAYIRTHFHEPISTSVIAQKLGSNPIPPIFKQKEGIPPSAYRRLYAKLQVNTG